MLALLAIAQHKIHSPVAGWFINLATNCQLHELSLTASLSERASSPYCSASVSSVVVLVWVDAWPVRTGVPFGWMLSFCRKLGESSSGGSLEPHHNYTLRMLSLVICPASSTSRSFNLKSSRTGAAQKTAFTSGCFEWSSGQKAQPRRSQPPAAASVRAAAAGATGEGLDGGSSGAWLARSSQQSSDHLLLASRERMGAGAQIEDSAKTVHNSMPTFVTSIGFKERPPSRKTSRCCCLAKQVSLCGGKFPLTGQAVSPLEAH